MNYLENVTDEQIIDFVAKHKGGFNDITIRRTRNNGEDIVEIQGETYGHYDEHDITYRYFYNAFGEMSAKNNALKLKTYSTEYYKELKDWLELVYSANKSIAYLEKFKDAHMNALYNQGHEECEEIDKIIEKLIDRKTDINNVTDQNMQLLLYFIENKIKEATNMNVGEMSLLVKAFLSNMSKEERIDWLAENGFGQGDYDKHILSHNENDKAEGNIY